MSSKLQGASRRLRGLIVPAVVFGAIAIVAIVYRSELLGWFRGEGSGGAWSATSRVTVGTITIDASVQPDAPRTSGNRIRVELADDAGEAIEGADVAVTYVMAAMGSMPEMKSTFPAASRGKGRYETPSFDLPMAGTWGLIVEIERGGATATARYSITIGTPGLQVLDSEGGAEPTSPAAPAIAGAPAAAATDRITIGASRRAQIGLTTGKVVRGPMTLDIRATGRLTYDERRLTDVTLKVGGYVTDLRVGATGQAVKKGQVLFSLYSPELYAAQQELLLSHQSKVDALAAATHKKLRLWGLTETQIAEIIAKGEPLEQVPFRSPASGYVIEKEIVEGAAVEAGMRLFRIAALDTIWVEADLYEADLAHVEPGTTADVALAYSPGAARTGTVTFVYPYLDPMTRTGRVRIELPNRGVALKPDMYATVTFHVALGDRVQVPSAAIIYTGPRRVVFVDEGGGKLRAQEVTVGVESGDVAEVLSGLDDGDVVVTSGNFLVAAESRLKSSSNLWKDAP